MSFVRHNLLPQLPAVLATWRPGQEGGNAIWQLLLGKESPSGRLSQAWPRSAGYVHSQASPWFSKRQGDFDQGSYRGGPSQQPGLKQDYPWEPLFPFGHGLQYTSFNLSIAQTSPESAVRQQQDKADALALHSIASPFSSIGTLNVSVSVVNTGAMPSKTVVALYYSKPLSSFVRYHKMLGTFAKTPLLKPGDTTTMTLTMPIAKLSAFDTKAGEQRVEPGAYTLTIGQDSVDVSGTVSITVA
eukprot:COSAG02_NODE_2005_length_10124_cov_15.739386_2_plen_243_part_00